VLYVVFDVMHFDGHDVTPLPFDQRVALLDELLDESGSWRRSSRHDDGAALLDVVGAQQLEGVMAKRLDAPYAPGRRSPSWRKIKLRHRGELVVGGWLPGAGARSGRLGAVLVGYYDDGVLRFAGRVGSGFSDNELDTLGELLAPLATSDDPFTPSLRRADAPGARFVRPEIVVEVAFGEWTPDGRLRHPSYLGRRFDKAAPDVGRP
jgi:bifunctional non-homologous end joining protein LigD